MLPLLNAEQLLNIDLIVVTPVVSVRRTVWLNLELPENIRATVESALVVVHVIRLAPSLIMLPLLNTEQLLNIDAIVVTLVRFEKGTVWLNAKQRKNIESALTSAVVANVNAFAPSSVALPLLNTEHLANRFVVVITPVVFERASFWLNKEQPANMNETSLSALVVVHATGLFPSPLLKTAHPLNIDDVDVKPVVSDRLIFWLKAKQSENMLTVLVSALVVVHVMECSPSLNVLPLLNAEHPPNMDATLVRPVVLERVIVWLSAKQFENMLVALMSALDVVHVKGCSPSFTVLPLLNREQLINIDASDVTLLMFEKGTVWLNALQLENIKEDATRAGVVHVSGATPPPLLNVVQPANIDAIVVALDVFHEDRFLLKFTAPENVDDMSVTALTSHVPMFDAAAVKDVHPAKHDRKDVVIARSGDPVVAVMSRLAHPVK